MNSKSRRIELDAVFSVCDENMKKLISPLLDRVVNLEERMEALERLPFVRSHPHHPELQKTTAAAKQYKECSQSYMNAVRILIGILNKVDESAADELQKRLAEFL